MGRAQPTRADATRPANNAGTTLAASHLTTQLAVAARAEAATTIYTLMMSPELTCGTISARFGLDHGIISQAQYSYLVATVIGSAVVPTVIANAFFMPSHLLSERPLSESPKPLRTARLEEVDWIAT